ELTRRLPRVSEVTLRRDILRLAEQGALERTRGGARRLARPKAAEAAEEDEAALPTPEIENVDAVVLPPISGRGASTLRMRARRRNNRFLAESTHHEGGDASGPDCFAVRRYLGARAAYMTGEVRKDMRLLLVSLEDLPYTRARCERFLQGFRSLFRGERRYG